MNNNINSPALFRSLIVYAVCVPLAIVVGYMLVNLTNYMDYQSMGFIGVLVAVLVFPLLMKWHYPLLIFARTAPLTLFFLPGRPGILMTMVVVSLTISVVERILHRDKPFVVSAVVTWPLLALLAVIFLTAELNGGFGFRSLGSDVYGGKKYAFLLVGILCYFAFAARPIPKQYANLYLALFFVGGTLNAAADFYTLVPSALHFIYLLLPMNSFADDLGNPDVRWGVTRLSGVSTVAGAVFYWMLARHGIRNILMTGKLWRPVVLGLSFIMIFMGGFRSSIIGAALVFGIMFVMEKLHRSVLMLPIVLFGIMGSVALVPLAPHLPYTFQRGLAFLPLKISPEARMDAEGSTQWRLDMWQALLPTIPNYLLLGKGFAFSAQEFNQVMGKDATFKTINSAEDPLALSGDFHSGPLSVVIPFGIWGVLAWLWFMAACYWVFWRNYRYGDPTIRHINLFMYAYYVVRSFEFFFIFGGIVSDVGDFGCLCGMSLALNHGVARPQPTPKPIIANPRPPLTVQPAFQR